MLRFSSRFPSVKSFWVSLSSSAPFAYSGITKYGSASTNGELYFFVLLPFVHQVTIFEREAKLGGQFNLAAVPPFKQELCLTLKYLSTQAKKVGVKVELGREVTRELIEELKPDVVVVATGAKPLIPNIPGAEKERVLTAWDILAGRVAKHPGDVIIIGGGMVGCETADLLADPGYNQVTGRTSVTILEMLRDIALDMMPEPRYLLLERLRAKEVKVITSAKVKEILDDGVVFDKEGEETTINSKGIVVLAMGATPVNDLAERIKGKVAEVYVVGDAKKPRKALEAIGEGAGVARLI